MALLRSSKGDAKAAADQAERLSSKLKPYAKDARARVAPVVIATRGRVQPAVIATRGRVLPVVVRAKDRVGPTYVATMDKVGPAYLATRERVSPTVDAARERLNEDVIPRVAGAIAVAAETMAERAGTLHDRAYEVSVAPQKRRRRRRRRIVLLVAGGAATVAGVSVLVKKNRSAHWEKFERQADEWASQAGSDAPGAASSTDATPTAGGTTDPFDGSSTRGLGDVASDDSAAAPPDEALSDVGDLGSASGVPTTPDDPIETTAVRPGPRRRSSSKPS